MASNQEKISATDLQNRVDAVAREVKYLSQQNTAMFENFEEKLKSLKREFAYLNQQNLSVYNMTTAYVQDALDKSQTVLEEKLDALRETIASVESGSSVIPAVEVVVDHDRIVDGIVQKLSERPNLSEGAADEDVAVEKIGGNEPFDYDVLAEKFAESMPPVDYDYLACKIVNNMTALEYDHIAADLSEKIAENMSRRQIVPESELTAESVADGVVARLQETSLNLNAETLAETLADKVVQGVASLDCENFASLVAEKVAGDTVADSPLAASDLNAETVAESVISRLREMPIEVDVDALANIMADRMQIPPLEVDFEELAENIANKIDVSALRIDTEELAESVANKIDLSASPVDYDAIAEKILEALPEVDYEALAAPVTDAVVAVLPKEEKELDVEALAETVAAKIEVEVPQIDEEAFADKVAETVLNRQSAAERASGDVTEKIGAVQAIVDSDEIALKVAELVPSIDYEQVATRVAEKLNGSEEEVEQYLSEHGIEVDETDSSERVITAVEENSGKTNALVEEVLELLKRKQFVTVAAAEISAQEEEEPAEEPVQELVDEPEEESAEEPVQELVDEPEEEPTEEPAEEPVDSAKPETDAQLELSIAEAAAETAAMAETAQELGKTVRLKRSYECKLRQSSEDVKYYYSEIKNELLSYSRVKSGISWNGDRFNFGRDTIAKININGKTLCLYLALNPDEYSITKYHHKYVGDVKAYESTPMLVKVKSNMGLKKAVALVFEMMEGLKAQRIHRTSVDYVAEYGYKSDEQMIAEGLIKASITEKKDLNSF